MAITFSWIILAALLGLILLQSVLVFKYFGFMVGRPSKDDPLTAPSFAPRVAVILCLRGDDPSLKACLESLRAQDYSNFEIHFVVDSPQDPALQTLEDFFLANPDSNVQSKTLFLTQSGDSSSIIESCSLKNQALIAAISAAEKAIEVFALIDADGVVEKHWLTDLIAPLAHQEVGATTGSRWFAPHQRNAGSLIRQTWNAAALPQMNFYNIPWGGALAIKRSTIENCDLLFHWSEGFCEDTMLPKILGENDYQVVQVPSVIVESKESTTLRSATTWISRQLLTVRLHHKSWPLVLGHAIFSGACLAGVVIAVPCCVLGQHYLHAGRLIATTVFFLIGNVVLLQVIDIANNGLTSLTKPKKSRGPGLYGACLTQLLYPMIAIKAALMRKVEWRGITYSIEPGKKISMDAYHPYQEAAETSGADSSI